MIITAIARYVFQCKNSNMSLFGQGFYGLYIFMHLIMRLTVPVAILATAENPNATLTFLPACLLCLSFFTIQFVIIYIYKFHQIPEFRDSPFEERLVHVLANTIVVIPFMTWDQPEPDLDLAMTTERIREINDRRRQRKYSLNISTQHSRHKRNGSDGTFAINAERSKSLVHKGHKR